MRTVSALIVLLCAAAATGQGIDVPAEVKGGVGDFIQVEAKADGKVRWVVIDSDLKLFPVHLLKDSRTAIVTSQKPGRYRLLAVTAKGDEPSEPVIATVIVGGSNPTPPAPVPPTPKPEDPFVKSLKGAYQLERGDTKDGHRLHLIETYRHGIELTKDRTITQVIGLLTRTQVKRKEGIPDSEFTQVRLAIQDELNKHLPREQTASLDDATRQKIADQFTRIIKALETLQ